MSGHSSALHLTDPANSASTNSTACPPSHGPASPPVSSPPSLTHSASSQDSLTPQGRNTGDQATTTVDNALERLAIGHAAVLAQQRTRPSESDYLAFERDLLDPENTRIAATAVHEFLAAMNKATNPPPFAHYDERENLQAFLIQMQLVAGIPVEQIRPMPEFGTQPDQNERIVRQRAMPSFLTIGRDGVYVPEIPPARFNGTVDPLPINIGLPNPTWVNQTMDNSRRQRDGSAINPPTTVNTPGQQPTQSMANPNNTCSNIVQNGKGFSTYFSSVKEQDLITQFFVEHFSTGSGILNLDSTEAEASFDDGTDSDYPTDYWSDTNDNAETSLDF